MKKCTRCTIGSWVVGLTTLAFAISNLLGYTWPSGLLAKVVYFILAIIALWFLYNQVVPCKQCLQRNGRR